MLIIDTLSVNKRVFNPNKGEQSNNIGIWDLTESSVSYDIRSFNFIKTFIKSINISKFIYFFFLVEVHSTKKTLFNSHRMSSR